MKLNYISTKLYLIALLFGAAAGLCYLRADSIYWTAFDRYRKSEIVFSGYFVPGHDEWLFASFVNLCFAGGFAVTGYQARRSED